LIVKVIIEKCTTQFNPGILMRYDIGRSVYWEEGDDHCGKEGANPSCVPR
jgi:hypothetical protein